MEQTAFGHWNLESTIDLGGKIIMFLQDLDWLSWELRKHTKFPNIGLQSFKTMVSHRCSELNLSQLAQVQYRRGPKWGRWICSCYHFRSKQAFNFGRVRWLLQELVNVRIEWGYIVYIYQPLVLTTQSCTQIKTAVSTIPQIWWWVLNHLEIRKKTSDLSIASPKDQWYTSLYIYIYILRITIVAMPKHNDT